MEDCHTWVMDQYDKTIDLIKIYRSVTYLSWSSDSAVSLEH